jgi:hypothetical protein
MPSDRVGQAGLLPLKQAGDVYRILDAVFGFGVWAAHLLVVYVSTAVACQLGLGSRPAGVQSTVVTALLAVTFLSAVAVVWHAMTRYRQQREMREPGFLLRIAVGHDAIAMLAILWQLVPILMVPLCR